MPDKIKEEILNKRLETLRAGISEQKLDAVILMSPANIYYYSGFFGEDSWLLVTREATMLISDGRYVAQAAIECPQCKVLCQNSTAKWYNLLEDKCKTLQIKSLGFEDNIFTYGQYKVMREALSNTILYPIADLASEVRQIKDETEIAALTKAADIGDAALVEVEKYFKVGVSEEELARELNYALYKLGAQGLAFPTIVAAGLNGAKPHAKPSDYKFQNGDLITLDFGAVYNGYHGDMTRTVAIGSVSQKVKDAYNLVQEAQAYAIANLRAGMSCHEGDDLARAMFEKAGFGEYFGHSLGHGTGLEIHEMPWLRKNNNAILKVGHVVTVEPGLYFPEWGGIRIEDTVVVKEDGVIPLNKYPKDLIIF